MKLTVKINEEDVEITLTQEQIAKINRSTLKITENSTFEDVLEFLGQDDLEIIEYNKLLKAGITSKAMYFQMAVCIVRALNDRHIFDWKNKNEQKWYIWWCMDEFRFDHCYCGSELSSVPVSLCFKNEKLTEIVKNNKEFTEIFKKFML